jgi:DNA polymerase sigma
MLINNTDMATIYASRKDLIKFLNDFEEKPTTNLTADNDGLFAYIENCAISYKIGRAEVDDEEIDPKHILILKNSFYDWPINPDFDNEQDSDDSTAYERYYDALDAYFKHIADLVFENEAIRELEQGLTKAHGQEIKIDIH